MPPKKNPKTKPHSVAAAKLIDGEAFLDADGNLIDPSRVSIPVHQSDPVVPPDVREVELILPVQEVHPDTSCPRHLSVRLNHSLSQAWRGLFDALHERGAKIKGVVPGTTKYVNSQADAIKYVLEQLE